MRMSEKYVGLYHYFEIRNSIRDHIHRNSEHKIIFNIEIATNWS